MVLISSLTRVLSAVVVHHGATVDLVSCLHKDTRDRENHVPDALIITLSVAKTTLDTIIIILSKIIIGYNSTRSALPVPPHAAQMITAPLHAVNDRLRNASISAKQGASRIPQQRGRHTHAVPRAGAS